MLTDFIIKPVSYTFQSKGPQSDYDNGPFSLEYIHISPDKLLIISGFCTRAG